MKMPSAPPDYIKQLPQLIEKDNFTRFIALDRIIKIDDSYRHWDVIRRMPAIKGYTHEEWWAAIKLRRQGSHREIGLRDVKNRPFVYHTTDSVQKLIHEIDFGAGGFIGMPDQITNPQTRDRYVVNSLIHEAITSSQLEGAATTVEVAKEMIRKGRKPRDRSERMILNNYQTMHHIIKIKNEMMSPRLILDIHRIITDDSLENQDAVGRFRRADELVQVRNPDGAILHDPPPASVLDERIQLMCDFANGKTPDRFIPPVVRAIILHFWLAYDHPFVDGNGRAARALFYWSMFHSGFWLFEFVSISNILLMAPSKYARSFLYTETDGNDLNYFIIYQAGVIHRAIRALHDYIKRKAKQLAETEAPLRLMQKLNHRQQALIGHALRHPYQEYTVASHRQSHNLAYDTARKDLLSLTKLGLLDEERRGRTMIFTPVRDLTEKLKEYSAG